MGLGKQITKLFKGANTKGDQNEAKHNAVTFAAYAYQDEPSSHRGCEFPLQRRDRGQTQFPIPQVPRSIAYETEAEHSSNLRLSRETRRFLGQITVLSLSHLLTWYVHHDVVPAQANAGHWFRQLPRELLVGWIRLGHEIGRGLEASQMPHSAYTLMNVLEELDLDEHEIYQRLVRLGNIDSMRQPEMADERFRGPSGFKAIAQKLEADRRLVKALRPDVESSFEALQSQTIKWIDTHLMYVVHPALEFPRLHSQAPTDTKEEALQITARKHFNELLVLRKVGPSDSLYDQALRNVNCAPTATSAFSTHYETQRRARPAPWHRNQDLDLRRRSAPALDASSHLVMSLQESLDEMKEELSKLRAQYTIQNAEQEPKPKPKLFNTSGEMSRVDTLRRLMIDGSKFTPRAWEYWDALQNEMRKANDSGGEQALDLPHQYNSPVRSSRGLQQAGQVGQAGPSKAPPAWLSSGDQEVFLHGSASKSTPNLTAPDAMPGSRWSFDHDSIEDISAELAVQERLYRQTAEQLHGGKLGSLMTHTRENSIQRSDFAVASSVLVARGLQSTGSKRYKRKAMYIHDPSSLQTQLGLQDGVVPLQTFASQLRAHSPSSIPRGEASIGPASSIISQKAEIATDLFQDFDDAFYHPDSYPRATSAECSNSASPSLTAPKTVQIKDADRKEALQLPERSSFRLSGSHLDQSKVDEEQKFRHDSPFPSATGSSIVMRAVEKQAGEWSPDMKAQDDGAKRLSGDLSEFHMIRQKVGNGACASMEGGKERKSKFTEDF